AELSQPQLRFLEGGVDPSDARARVHAIGESRPHAMVPGAAEPGTKPAVALFELRELRKNFGPLVLFDGVDLDIHRGEVITIIGASGSGKSVLLKSILGLLPMDGGATRSKGREIANL